MLDVEGFILVGGLSRRMGKDKSRLVFGKQTVVERIATQLGSVTEQVSLVGTGYNAATLRVVPDVYERWGALGGIHAALTACRAEWAAIVACDLPFVTADLFSRLSTFRQQADAVVPIQSDGRPQPVCALYRREACLQATEVLVATGEHTPRALLAKVRTRWVRLNELKDLSGSENFFFNVNRPEDYERARALLL
jgi:molybdenum cofactor guanylyltransferase